MLNHFDSLQATMWWVWCVFIFSVCLASKPKPDKPLITTVEGVVKGERLTTYSGKSFYSFRGVRYAESPTGANRFRPPVPVKPWKGVYNATKDNKNSKMVCPQPDASISSKMSEDCLFLNVYTKKLTGSKPVMVFFHPGAFAMWTGSSEWFGPEYLLDKDIVLVTVNYRLGALGFLSLQDKLLKGNYGMKDQVAAMRWVKRNIASFGGDPRKVTIFGYSAGGVSVMLHMMSPMSRGLFRNCIAMSGSATHGWAINREQISNALRLAQQLNCTGTSPAAVYQCLQDLPADAIVRATSELKALPEHNLNALVFYAPVVEQDYGDGKERFLTADPWELIEAGNFTKVPLLTGVTKDEFAHVADYVLQNATLAEAFDANFEMMAPIEFIYERQSETSKKISQALKNFYFNGKPMSNSNLKQFRELFADSTQIFGSVQSAQILAQRSSKPVYFYQFSYLGDRSFNTKPGTNEPSGVVEHHDLLLYLFNMEYMAPMIKRNDTQAKMVQTITKIWTEFAKTGVPPLPDGSQWPRFSPSGYKYVNISLSLDVIDGVPFSERMAFWESLFPLSGPHQKYY